MMTRNAQEEAKLAAMQRAWQSRRGLTSSLFEDIAETEELLTLPRPSSRITPSKGQFPVRQSSTLSCADGEAEAQSWDNLQEQLVLKSSELIDEKPPYLTLDASSVGDLPARYTICALEPHQLPVVGVYIDRRVVPGFKYRIRPLPCIGQKPTVNKCMFNDRALTLKSIGRGYARRLTFEAYPNNLNNNDNYFWSDNRPEGYAFELEVISEGDKFTIFDTNQEAQGTLEVLKIEGPQLEISNVQTKHGVEKRANVRITGKVEFFETGVAKPMPLSGTVISLKSKNRDAAEIVKVLNVFIQRHRYVLRPGIQKTHRRVTVRGQDINDVPTKYSMNGLEPHELPVVGTYVDPSVIPGFYYKVRPNDRRDHLFGGRALKLLSIGMGYAKRLTFQPDSLLEPDNYLWSDNHPDGLGLEVRAIRRGMKFIIKAADQLVGEASVFRADKPQTEHRMEKVKTPSGRCAIEKYIHIDVMCHVKIEIPGGGSAANDEHLMRVYGLAVVRKEPNVNEAHVVRVENVGLDSQLKVLFAQTRVELTFYPKK